MNLDVAAEQVSVFPRPTEMHTSHPSAGASSIGVPEVEQPPDPSPMDSSVR